MLLLNFCSFLSVTVEAAVIPNFFSYKTIFSFQNNPKNLDLSYRASRSLGRFRKSKTRICSHSREGKTPSYSHINMVALSIIIQGGVESTSEIIFYDML